MYLSFPPILAQNELVLPLASSLGAAASAYLLRHLSGKIVEQVRKKPTTLKGMEAPEFVVEPDVESVREALERLEQGHRQAH